jgi:hypothetical protein
MVELNRALNSRMNDDAGVRRTGQRKACRNVHIKASHGFESRPLSLRGVERKAVRSRVADGVRNGSAQG